MLKYYLTNENVDINCSCQCRHKHSSENVSTLSSIFNFDIKMTVKNACRPYKIQPFSRPPKITIPKQFFANIFGKKITNSNCKNTKDMQNTFVTKLI